MLPSAGTSTGGLNNKEYRRVGDSPIIGAGTYASNDTCAVSCTGAGENFIKEAVAHSVSGMMKWGGASLVEACDAVIYGEPATVCILIVSDTISKRLYVVSMLPIMRSKSTLRVISAFMSDPQPFAGCRSAV